MDCEYSVPIPPGGPMGIYFVDFDVQFHPSCMQDIPLCHELIIFHCRQPVQEFCVCYYVCMLVLQNRLNKKIQTRADDVAEANFTTLVQKMQGKLPSNLRIIRQENISLFPLLFSICDPPWDFRE